jgi:hypothetical protein
MSQALNGEFSSATIRYSWECAKCGREETQHFQVRRFEQFPLAGLPAGWRQFEDRIYCNRHKLVFLVDGEVVQ